MGQNAKKRVNPSFDYAGSSTYQIRRPDIQYMTSKKLSKVGAFASLGLA